MIKRTTDQYSEPPSNVSGYDPTREAGNCTWDPRAAEHACEFFPSCLTHVQGFSGRFDLSPWQRDIIATLFGWKRNDGTRRYRESLIAVPRKNGKSALCAGLGLYLLRCDNERGPQVYCAASTADQATMVFSPAAAMVRQHEVLSGKLRVLDTTKRIICEDNGGFLRAIPAEAAQAHGFNASAVLYDELHTAPNRELYDVLKTSQGARTQSAIQSKRGGPLFVSITTAGFDRHSICWEVWNYARQVRDGLIADPYFLPAIYEIADGEEWSDREVWRRVNPNLDVSVSEEFLAGEFARASEVPAYENTFRNLYLNQWTEQAVRWLSIDRWDKCVHDVPDEWYRGKPCYAGLDLSSKEDISALVLVFPAEFGYALQAFFWVPADNVQERERRDRVPYRQWIKDGYIKATGGCRIDYTVIEEDIAQLARMYDICEMAVDPWNASHLMDRLQTQHGVTVFEHSQGIQAMNTPTKEFGACVSAGQLHHGRNPVLRWMAGNVAIQPDQADNIRPHKGKSSDRIDGIVAAIMAVGRAALHAGAKSAYDQPTGMYASDFADDVEAEADKQPVGAIYPADLGYDWSDDDA